MIINYYTVLVCVRSRCHVFWCFHNRLTICWDDTENIRLDSKPSHACVWPRRSGFPTRPWNRSHLSTFSICTSHQTGRWCKLHACKPNARWWESVSLQQFSPTETPVDRRKQWNTFSKTLPDIRSSITFSLFITCHIVLFELKTLSSDLLHLLGHCPHFQKNNYIPQSAAAMLCIFYKNTYFVLSFNKTILHIIKNQLLPHNISSSFKLTCLIWVTQSVQPMAWVWGRDYVLVRPITNDCLKQILKQSLFFAVLCCYGKLKQSLFFFFY